MGSTITEIEIEIDCIDPVKFSGFWSLVLGWEMHHDGDLCRISATGEHVPGDLMLVFAPVPESKTAKNRLHIDVSPLGCSQEDEVTRLIGLGARRADVGQGECRWIVLADPEGNEFCLRPTQVGQAATARGRLRPVSETRRNRSATLHWRLDPIKS